MDDHPRTAADRRQLLKGLGLLGAAALAPRAVFGQAGSAELLKPARLQAGDRIGLVNPATAAFETGPIDILRESLEALGLEVVL